MIQARVAFFLSDARAAFAVQERDRRRPSLHMHVDVCSPAAPVHVPREKTWIARPRLQGLCHRHTPQPVRLTMLLYNGGRGAIFLASSAGARSFIVPVEFKPVHS